MAARPVHWRGPAGAATGFGACTLCVLCGMNLPLVDVKAGALQSYVEVVAGESQVATKVQPSRCPVWGAPFLLELSPSAQVVELTVRAKSTSLNVTKGGDPILGVVSLLLSELPPDLASAWHDVVPLRPEPTPTLISTRASPMVTPPPEPSPLPWPSPRAGAAAAAHGHQLLGPCPLGARTGYRLALTLTLSLTLTLTSTRP